jgi:hypothetical protein
VPLEFRILGEIEVLGHPQGQRGRLDDSDFGGQGLGIEVAAGCRLLAERVEASRSSTRSFRTKPVMPRRIIIGTDPGIDDAVALFLALAAPEELEVLGIYPCVIAYLLRRICSGAATSVSRSRPRAHSFRG